MLPTNFQVNWLFGSRDEAKKIFSRWPPWWPHGFPIETILATSDLQVTLIFLLSLKSIGLLVQEKKRKTDFQDGSHGGHRGFSNGKLLAFLIFKSS